MNHILEINPEERWVRVQPGVVLDELNLYCKPYGLFFGPETSTSNRCCLGGMVGNNSCGSHSLVYGSTRDHLLEAKVILSDGSKALLKGMSPKEVDSIRAGASLESSIYDRLITLLSNKENQKEIVDNYPDASLRRRNSDMPSTNCCIRIILTLIVRNRSICVNCWQVRKVHWLCY